ncbi:helix-turn-helix domain-containing protein [Persephonella sp.]
MSSEMERLTHRILEMPKEWCDDLPIFSLKVKGIDKKIFVGIIGRNIRIFRKLKKLDQKDLDEKIGLPIHTTAKIENFQRTIYAYELFKYAEVLEVSLEDLTSIRLPYKKFTRLSPFELYVLPNISLSYNLYLERVKDKEKAEDEIKNALEIFDKVPEIWKLLGNIDAKKLKKLIKLMDIID